MAVERLTSDSPLVMASVRMAARSVIRHNFRWFTGWIGTKDTRLVDALSRSQWNLLSGLADMSQKQRYLVPFTTFQGWLRTEPA